MRMAFGRRVARVGFPAALLVVTAIGARADTVTLAPVKDNTLIETPLGNSNGAGDGVFAGRVSFTGGGTTRRALMAFDLSAIPAGSTINTVTLTLAVASTNDPAAETTTMHRVNADWGEAGSIGGGQGALAQPNECTWTNRFDVGTPWAAAGGDFVATASASQDVADVGTYAWSGAGLVADVQYWLDHAGTNFGWLLKGNESTYPTVKKFYSREGFTPPSLVIDYTRSTNGIPTEPAAGVLSFAAPYPTPARGDVRLDYSLPNPAVVTLTIVDAAGRRVRELASGAGETAGRHTRVWDGLTDAGVPAAPGVYLANLRVGAQSFSRRIARLQ